MKDWVTWGPSSFAPDTDVLVRLSCAWLRSGTGAVETPGWWTSYVLYETTVLRRYRSKSIRDPVCVWFFLLTPRLRLHRKEWGTTIVFHTELEKKQCVSDPLLSDFLLISSNPPIQVTVYFLIPSLFSLNSFTDPQTSPTPLSLPPLY